MRVSADALFGNGRGLVSDAVSAVTAITYGESYGYPMAHYTPRTTAPMPAISVAETPPAQPERSLLGSRAAAVAAALLGSVILTGWLLDAPALRALGSGNHAATNPLVALLLTLGGAALWFATQPGNDAHRFARLLSLSVGSVAAFALVDAVSGFELGLDRVLFEEAMRSTPDGRHNRMSPASAFALALYASALLALLRRRNSVVKWAQGALLLNLLLALTVFLAFLYRAGWFESIGAATRMARPSALGIALLSLGALALRPQAGATLILISDGPGGALARRLLPAALALPILLGFILLEGRRSELVGAELAIMLFVVASIVSFSALVAWIATQLHESHVERARAEEALRDSEVRFRLLAENASDVVSLHDLGGRVLYASPSCERVFGFTPEDLARMRPFAIVHPEDRARATEHHEMLLRGDPVTALTCRMLHSSGRHVWVETSWRTILNRSGKVVRLQAASRDVTDRRESERKLEEAHATLRAQQERLIDANMRLEALASLDSLTGLKNRRAFEERLLEEIARARRTGQSFALLLLDIDHFKNFNDSFGHPRGDDVLKAVARLLSRGVRDSDFIARHGGEEFAIILPDTDRDGAKLMGERLRAAIEEHAWDVRPITASVGAASWVESATAETLIDQADRALYRSKQGGRNIVTLADAA
ncbi:MAG: diguanylate cyclase [Gemmatimonadaceae bacterium]